MKEENRKKNAELPKIRLESDLHNEIINCLETLNNNPLGIEISLSVFRRMALRFFIRTLKEEGLKINWSNI